MKIEDIFERWFSRLIAISLAIGVIAIIAIIVIVISVIIACENQNHI
jgi:hypothetical protein